MNKKIVKANKKIVKMTITTPLIKSPDKDLVKAAKKVAKEVTEHFKNNKYPLDYSLLVNDVFMLGKGHGLGDYLVSALIKEGRFELIGKDGRLLLKPSKKVKK